ncbi:MAG TPA: GTPase HflX, partial [Acidimicrobiia bacterium]|nr:GTPase HflX [Acidimicrobiia bacterium]
MTSPAARGRRRLTATEVDLEVVRQRALLVGTGVGTRSTEEAEASLDELALLADTAGAEPIESVLQRRDHPDPATYIGSGKADELRGLADALDVDVVIFDDELTPAQQRNLEKLFARDVVDRVALILDIFAQHAHSQEGMVQVELAQLRYRLPRLRGRGLELSQQGGGIGTRGPGETQLEVDRRRIQRRITKLERDLAQLARTRATQRKARRRRALLRVALVGYTNAGKST